MNGGHLTMADSEVFMNDFHHRSQTIGGTGRCGQQMMTGGIITVVIHAHHHIQHIICHHRGRDDYLFDALIEIGLSQLFAAEFTCTIQHNLRA